MPLMTKNEPHCKEQISTCAMELFFLLAFVRKQILKAGCP